jgi:cytochrome b561
MQISRYTRPAIALHWLIALFIIANVLLAWIWPFLADENVRPVINWHKTIGILVLGLAIMRLLWRFSHRPPPLPAGFQKWEVRTSQVTHLLLYVIMFGMPLSGWIFDSAWEKAPEVPMMFMNLFEWPRIGFIMALDPATKETIHDLFEEVHEILAYLLYGLFVLHVAGALKHQWLDKTPELQRMWPR